MSFFMVPSVSYQTKIKMEERKKEKEKEAQEAKEALERQREHNKKKKRVVRRHRSKDGSTSGDTGSIYSYATDTGSIHSRTKHPSQSSQGHSTHSHSSTNSSQRTPILTESASTTPPIPVSIRSMSNTNLKGDAMNPDILIESLNDLKESEEPQETFEFRDSDPTQSAPTAIAERYKASFSSDSTTPSIGQKSPTSKHLHGTSSPSSSNPDLPSLEKSRNDSAYSANSSSSSQHHSSKFRRNSSQSSTQSTPNINPLTQASSGLQHKSSATSRFSRKLSSIILGGSPTPESKSIRSTHSPLNNETYSALKPSLFKSSYDNEIPSYSSDATSDTDTTHDFAPGHERYDLDRTPSELDIPQFVPVVSLSYLNSVATMKDVLLTPSFQIFRYNNFLDILSDHNHSDPVNFASTRNQSLQKFINKYKVSKDYSEKYSQITTFDGHIFEGILAHEILEARTFLRHLIRRESEHSLKKVGIINHEELLQVNFVNWVRYIVNLPLDIDRDYLNDEERIHYKYKDLFTRISDLLYAAKKEDVGGELPTTGENEVITKSTLLIQLITKVSYEYIILEKYYVHILSTFNNNSIIDSRSLSELYLKHRERVKTGNTEQLKVLLYNTTFSAQYAWFLSLTIPFVRVFETSIYSESQKVINDEELYDDIEKRAVKTSFASSDKELFESFTKKLYINDYKQYRSTTPDKLVRLHKMLDNNSPKYAHLNRRHNPEPSSSHSHKPMNFEYYSEPLFTIESNSFEHVHCRDLPFQIPKQHYKTIFRQFHRILKPGGIVEIPILNVGNDEIREYVDKKYLGAVRTKSQAHHMLMDKYNIMPNSVQHILQGLLEVFGKSHVKYSMVLLNKTNEINHFIFKHACIIIHEMLGKMADCCMNFEESGKFVPIEEDSADYYLLIRVIK